MSKANVDYIRRRRRFSVVLLMTLIVLFYTLLVQAAGISGTELSEPPSNAISASQALEDLEIHNRESGVNYSREHFSPGWADIKGCDMRNRILQRDLEEISLDEDNCTVLSGTLNEAPFTGQTIDFARGRSSSQTIHIDHLVPVSDAWQKGAQHLSYEQRHSFYNDPLNLLAVDSKINMEKGDKDASRWLPRAAYRCRYIARQIAVKTKYMLWITRAEYNAMRRVLRTCPKQVLPVIKEP